MAAGAPRISRSNRQETSLAAILDYLKILKRAGLVIY